MDKQVLIITPSEQTGRELEKAVSGINSGIVSRYSSFSDAQTGLPEDECPFDIVVLDAEITEDWEEATIDIKNRSLLCDIMLIGDPSLSSRAEKAGVASFLETPVLKEEFLFKIQEIVENQELRDEDLDKFHVDEMRADWLELTASSEVECVERFRSFTEILFQADLPSKVKRDLKIAINELGQNAIEWGNQFDHSKKIRMSYALFDDRIMLKIEDEGRGFDFRNLENPTADPIKFMKKREASGKRVGGYGVFLVKKLMDNVIYNEKGNLVIMTKLLKTCSPESSQEEDEKE